MLTPCNMKFHILPDLVCMAAAPALALKGSRYKEVLHAAVPLPCLKYYASESVPHADDHAYVP